MKMSSDWSRRDFLATIASVGAGMTFVPGSTWAADEIDPQVASISIVSSTMGIDTHNHIDVPLTVADVPGPDLDLAGELKRSGLSAICATFAVDYQKLNEPGVAYDRFLNALKSMDTQLARNHMQRALNLKDLQAAHQQSQPIIIQAVEGGHFLEGKLERLEDAYKKGLRVLGLLHDSDASVPLGDIYTNPPRWGGLTEFGASVVKECNRLGILIDLTHCNAETVVAALKISSQPMVFTHTGLDSRLGNNSRMGQMMRPRLISKEHAKVIADAGGVIGVWTHLVDSPAEYVEAIRAMADAVGIDHVCLGTDTKLTPASRGGFGGPNGGPPGRKPDAATNSAPNGFSGGPGGAQRGAGPGNGRQRPGERTNQIWADQKNGFYYAVVEQMLKQGFTTDEIGKVGGGNFCRAFDAVTASHA